jgi:hypothetical protein
MMSEPSSGILGRISGKLLSSNLIRDGIDLTVRNSALDPDLFYLDVNNLRVGINLTPNFDLHFSDGRSVEGIVDNQLTIDNNDLVISNSQISSLTNNIIVSPAQDSNPKIVMEKNQTQQLEINDNYIRNYTTNGSVILDAKGTGTIRLEENTSITGDLYVTGNITLTGDLSKQGNLIVGDDIIDGEGNLPENDIIDFNVPFSQDLLPGLDDGYDLGGSRGDSSAGRWAELHTPDNLVNTTNVLSLGATVSDQLLIDGVNGQILSIQSNDDVIISPDTGVTRIENIIFRSDSIVNLASDSTPLVFSSTGIGYFRFAGTNAMVFPSGTTAEKIGYEVGATRWNTEEQFLESFDGTTWNLSIGIGQVSVQEMEELGVIYTLILG